MRIISESIYRNIFEAMLFVSILSLFEFSFFYGMTVPNNTKSINNKLEKKVKQFNFTNENNNLNSSKSNDNFNINNMHFFDIIGNLINQDLNKITNNQITEQAKEINKISSAKNALKYLINKRLESYRIVFKLFDKEFEEENIKKFYLTIIVILICFIITILWFIYGYYFYGYTITKESMLISLPITFIFVATGQVFLVLYIIPKFILANDSNVEAEVYKLLKQYQQEFKSLTSFFK